MSKENIKFGTDGWRGVIAKDFTFENLTYVSIATAEKFLSDLKSNPKLKNLVFIGYDRRFLGEEFAERVARVFTAKGLNVNLYNKDVPTPMVSYDVRKNGCVGGIVITASHNPANFSGFKIKQPEGSSAAKDFTSKVEDILKTISEDDICKLNLTDIPTYNLIPPSVDYINYLKSTLNTEKLKTINGKIIIDPMHGAGGSFIEDLLSGGKLEVQTIRKNRDVYFGGVNPEPMMPQLTPLCEAVKKEKALIGLATDGDADRVGAVDETGSYINTHKILSILLYYFAEKKKLTGGVVVTFSQSVLVKRIAKKYRFKIYEVPIGFKFIADLMIKEDILIGGEEANGIGSKLQFMPDRDGIFNSLLLFEAINSFQIKPSELINKLHSEFGTFYYDRIDMHIKNPATGKEFVSLISKNPPKEVNGQKIQEVQTLDGTKFVFEDESWLLFRGSGTEPVLRIYSEALSPETVKSNLKFGEKLYESSRKTLV